MVDTNATPNPAPKATAAKKAKEPALEDKPFGEFMVEYFLPALDSALKGSGLNDIQLQFVEQSLPLLGSDATDLCWQVIGAWQQGQRQFNLYFFDHSIGGQKAFSWSTPGNAPSTLESFMIDERKVTLDLMVLYTLQRLNGQKWLSGN